MHMVDGPLAGPLAGPPQAPASSWMELEESLARCEHAAHELLHGTSLVAELAAQLQQRAAPSKEAAHTAQGQIDPQAVLQAAAAHIERCTPQTGPLNTPGGTARLQDW
eukprot:TRINITY_DN7109_c0_g1_i2.p3 TRINITY_DN7109_c0_g1~~TRINITY_DN7109_c0_g1_i2.p3  ORF type:complete len:108 (-),score=35.36 TRINITY_DN7109_c0_g1_i2:374-697(-)